MNKKPSLLVCAAAEGICQLPKNKRHCNPHARMRDCRYPNMCEGEGRGAICVKVAPAKDTGTRRML